MFVNENINPKNKKSCDCVIRAIANAENQTWLKIFDRLTILARENYDVLNSNKIYTKYLDAKYEKINAKHIVNGKNKRYMVKEVADTFENGIYIVSVANHLTVVKNGNYHDTWDCGDCCAYIIWKVK